MTLRPKGPEPRPTTRRWQRSFSSEVSPIWMLNKRLARFVDGILSTFPRFDVHTRISPMQVKTASDTQSRS
jgi:hypothetical protein